MSLISRKAEQQTLANLLQSPRAEFLALYGRRRIGKTFLIKHFFSDKKCSFIHITGIKNARLSQQVSQLITVIADVFHKGSEIKPQSNWIDAFRTLTDSIEKHAANNKKIVIFLDEFPWMATPKSQLIQALDYFWNHHWSHDPRIKLIICGSSASWIINKIINNKSGLHNRVTRKILLKPFTLQETQEFLDAQGVRLNHWQVTQIYMATGGIPFYLSFIEKGQSASQAIESLAFSDNAPLLTEFDNLFSSLFENETPYIELLTTIAKHRYGINQFAITKSQHFSEGGSLTNRLKALKDTGFIVRFKPHQHKKKGLYYRVIDEYTLFYFYWIEPIRDTLQEESLTKGYWQGIQKTPSWHSWAGYTFESIVYKHLPQIRAALNIPTTAIANTWRYVPRKQDKTAGAQIDLLFDRQDGVITLCEIKFSEKPFTITKAYAAELLKKRDVFIKQTRSTKQIFITMITACGIKANAHSKEIISAVVTLSDLFKDC